ncbi:MAG: DUF4197 domain-containing protein [Saprospiraceae bacterium]|nr:DUF4197 domain-containing protein [Saprospiraceae bacterium]
MIRILLLSLLISFASCDVLKEVQNSVMSDPSNEEIIAGLKEALSIGISKGSDLLSKEDGYYKSIYKILLPEEARKVTDKLKVVPGFTNVEEEIVKRLNRAAEDAAKSAKPIFVDAIKKMTINDAINILMGQPDAATRYLENSTYDGLYTAFQPKIVESLNQLNALEYWEKAVTAYNKIPFVDKVNPKLDDYVARQALDGLFDMVEKEEAAIRQDPSKRVSALLKKVFAKQDS